MAVHLREDSLLAAKSNREFLFGGAYPGTGGVSGKVEQKVLSAALKEVILSSLFTLAGRRFPSLGPTTAKELS